MNGKNSQTLNFGFFRRIHLRRGFAFGLIIIAALIAFELFNYSTTEYALTDLLGDPKFLGIGWAMILAIAFCGIDFAGIARLLTPGEGHDEPGEVWYLFGAWLLAATMNAMLTWWGVSIAILNHQTLGNAVVDHQTLLRAVPIFVAVMVWLIRVLIIGTLSVAGVRLFTQSEYKVSNMNRSTQPATNSTLAANAARLNNPRIPAPRTIAAAPPPGFRPAPKSNNSMSDSNNLRQEPVYQPIGAQMSGPGNSSSSQPVSTNPSPFGSKPGTSVRR